MKIYLSAKLPIKRTGMPDGHWPFLKMFSVINTCQIDQPVGDWLEYNDWMPDPERGAF